MKLVALALALFAIGTVIGDQLGASSTGYGNEWRLFWCATLINGELECGNLLMKLKSAGPINATERLTCENAGWDKMASLAFRIDVKKAYFVCGKNLRPI